MEQVIANGLYLGAQYALIALGLTLIFALMNVLNFAHGQMYVLGGFVTYEVYGLMKLPFVVALIASALTLAVLGAALERFLFRTVIRRSEREESTMLLAAGVAYFLDAAILLMFGEKQRGVHKIVNGVFILGQPDPAVGPHPRRGPRRPVHRRLHPDDAVHQARPRHAGDGAGPGGGAADGRAGRVLRARRLCARRDARRPRRRPSGDDHRRQFRHRRGRSRSRPS